MITEYKNYRLKEEAFGSLELAYGMFGFLGNREIYKELGYPIFIDYDMRFFILYDKDPIGFFILRLKKNVLNICYTYVGKKYRKQGIHSYMLDFLFTFISEYKTITASATQMSQSFYIKNDFQIIKQTKNFTWFKKEIK
jgi:GNAT superfamily N-acetyltransferase